ncbi:MAG: zinc ABC transporter substrate-binding protein [Pirellulaceae bacterium]
MNTLAPTNSLLWQVYRGALLVGLCSATWLLVSTGCRPNASSTASRVSSPHEPFSGEYPIEATVTIGMLGDLVRQIGGEHVRVTQLMGAGVDPHLYKPLRDAVLAIRSADIVFYNGLLLEGKMSELLAQHGRTHRTFAAGDTLTSDIVGGDDPHSGHPDPHVWMNVSLWSQVAEGVGKELAEFDPPHAEDYARATEQLRNELAALHAYGQQIVGCIPAEQRVLVTSHDAFRYFGEAYDVEVQAVQGISTESEAGLSRINELVDMLVARKVGAIFTESSVPQDSIRALLRGAESKGHQVRIPDTPLYSDAMGDAGTYSGTYIGMMDHNFTTIARELGCPRVPAGGFRELQLKQ